jgi:hypothetical protein
MKEMEEEKKRIEMLKQKGANPRDQENNEESKLT